ncbi:hypothetical protein [Nocardioides sp. Kera G14]|uniref:hypothetical protein n=1 Tax=Nocardioides sp. Kera G14 TaxID=2884264 RepID=UPI001D114042|nr:hypothetical protein [Nocardioides sp. Kera G14]UDY23549.1 hypothetical protein LH076_16015 [Nocardioides sp. Kera G14]
MRTTVTLDPDVEQLVRERMAAKGVSFKRALNDAIRESTPRVDYVFETPSSPLGLKIDLEHAGAVLSDLDVDDFLSSAHRDR